jgi:hypothetical protein
LNILNKADFNGGIKPDVLHSSIIFYSLERSGSTFVMSLLKRLIQDIGNQWIPLDDYSWKIRTQVDCNPEQIRTIFKLYGYCYACIRDPRDWSFLDVSSYQKLLILRDPRDVLTSSYFFFGLGHSLPRDNSIRRKAMLGLKVEALRSTIDDYVIKVMPKYIEIYQFYIQMMIDQPDIVFLTYEQMVGSFDFWLDTLIAGLRLDINPHLMDQIKHEANFVIEKEDIYDHKRQVEPGDHRRKLRPETIEILNASFAEILDTLGYPI